MVDHPSTYSLNALEINQNKVKQEALVSIYGLPNPGNPGNTVTVQLLYFHNEMTQANSQKTKS